MQSSISPSNAQEAILEGTALSMASATLSASNQDKLPQILSRA